MNDGSHPHALSLLPAGGLPSASPQLPEVQVKRPPAHVIGCLVALLVAVTSGLEKIPAWAAQPLHFIRPVDGPTIRNFEGPENPFAAGHRGIDLEVPFGTAVLASAEGRVTFAGPMGGRLFVTVTHVGEIVTTYSFLSRVDVRAGQHVRHGDPLAASGEGHPGQGPSSLHFGVRLAGSYVDPDTVLFAEHDASLPEIALAPVVRDPVGIRMARGPRRPTRLQSAGRPPAQGEEPEAAAAHRDPGRMIGRSNPDERSGFFVTAGRLIDRGIRTTLRHGRQVLRWGRRLGLRKGPAQPALAAPGTTVRPALFGGF